MRDSKVNDCTVALRARARHLWDAPDGIDVVCVRHTGVLLVVDPGERGPARDLAAAIHVEGRRSRRWSVANRLALVSS
jgi:hypothetical protein